MAKIIAVTSGKGGAGKSTCCIGLATALSKLNKRVLLVDMDEGMRCLDMLLGVSEKLLFDLSDAVGGRELSSCLLDIPRLDNLSLLAAPAQKGLIKSEPLKEFISALQVSEFDTVIFDMPAGNDKKLYEVFPAATDFICICNPNAVSVRDAAAVGTALTELSRNGRLIINKYQRFFVKNPVFSDLDDIINQSGLQLLGIVPDDERLAYAFLTGKFPLNGKIIRTFSRIANRIYEKNVRLPKLKKL